MFGAIDLKSGAGSPTGVNLFHMDKNPLDELYEGLDSIMGNQGEAIGTGLATFFEFTIKLVQGLIDAILGLPSEFLAEFGPLLAELEGGVLGSLLNLGTFFDNLIGFLGNINLLDEAFTVASSVEHFITNVLTPSAWFTDLVNLLGATGLGTGSPLSTVATNANSAISNVNSLITGVGGTAITDVVNLILKIQQIIDTVVHSLGISGSSFSLAQLGTNIQSALTGILPAVVNNVDGTFTALTGITNNANGTFSYTPGTNPVNTIINNLDGTFSTVAGTLQQAATSAQQVGSNFVQGVSGFWGSIFGALNGAATPPAATPAQAYTALSNQATTTANNSANLGGMTGLTVASVNQALQRSSAGLGGSSGTNVTINFSSYANANDLSTAGFSGASGYIGVRSGRAAWVGTGGFSNQNAYYTTPTTSDYQVVSMALGPLDPNGVEDRLIGRCNSALNTYAYFDTNTLSLGCVVSGVNTTFWSLGSMSFSQGDILELICGDEPSSNLYTFQVLRNGVAVHAPYVDGGHVSQVGSSNRFAGLGMNGSGTQSTTPISSWGVADNAPPTVIGSGFKAYCSRTSPGSGVTPSPSTITVAGLTLNILKFPASCFDTTQWITSDYTYNSSTNTLTVTNACWLSVSVSAAIVTSALDFTGVGFFHNGTWQQCGQAISWASGSTTVIRDKFDVYCAAGDTLTPGLYYNGGFSFSGDANGYGTSWGVNMTNVGTLS